MNDKLDIVEIGDVWVYRQPGGCIEIGQLAPNTAIGQELIHMHSDEQLKVQTVIDALTKMLAKNK